MADPRKQVLEALYEAEQGSRPPDFSRLSGKALRLARGVWEHRQELDAALEEVSRRWRVERMPAVDRTLLRLGLYELRYEPHTPVGVVISEAVRLAKEYSTEHSGAFVNGLLGRLAREEREEP